MNSFYLLFLKKKKKKSTYWNKQSVFFLFVLLVSFFFSSTFKTGARIKLVCTLEIKLLSPRFLILSPLWDIALHSETFNWIFDQLVRTSYSVIYFSDSATEHMRTHTPITHRTLFENCLSYLEVMSVVFIMNTVDF